MGRKYITDKTVLLAIEMHNAKIPWLQVAEKLDVNSDTLRNRVQAIRIKQIRTMIATRGKPVARNCFGCGWRMDGRCSLPRCLKGVGQ